VAGKRKNTERRGTEERREGGEKENLSLSYYDHHIVPGKGACSTVFVSHKKGKKGKMSKGGCKRGKKGKEGEKVQEIAFPSFFIF